MPLRDPTFRFLDVAVVTVVVEVVLEPELPLHVTLLVVIVAVVADKPLEDMLAGLARFD